MGVIFNKKNVRVKELTILSSVLAFLVFAYWGGDLKWMGDFQLFIDLLASMFAFFIGVLALVRFYTKKNNLNYLFLGYGFLTVGSIEVGQILTTLGAFSDLFTVQSNQVFPTTVVISRLFLSFILLASWLLLKEEYRERRRGESLVFVLITTIVVALVALISFFTETFAGYTQYMFAIVGQTISLFVYMLALIGYVRSRGIFYRNFDFWLIFSIVFAILSQIFFLPYLNLEYQLMLNLATLAKFFSYFILLLGFLFSVYEMYKKEEEHQKELQKKNLILAETKKKVEEAYMLLREEKWQLTKENEKNTADKIMKDILKNN